MRAERLVAIALLLQAHGQLTAPALARRLEVSERTIRRDLDALLNSGLPLYSLRGRGGGWALTDGYKVDLSALTAEEARALFLAAGPELLTGLGIEHGVTSALRKLLAALPESTRQQARMARRTIHVDPIRWGQHVEKAPPALVPLHAAVLAGLQVDLTYAKPGQDATVRRVHPYGLVSKTGVWYLLAGTTDGIRTFRASRVIDAATTSEPIERPQDFDLVRAWEETNQDMPVWANEIRVEIDVEPGAVSSVMEMMGSNHLEPSDGTASGADGRRRFSATFPSVKDAVSDLIYLGNGVRALAPPAVCAELARIGKTLVATYAED